MDFYRRECRRLQNEAPTAVALCRARRLLKLLDDLLDEGYAELAERLEAEQMGPSFLRGYLREHHADPFPMPAKEFDARKLSYGTEEIELCQAVDRALSAAKRTEEAETPAFLRRLRDFCRWIGYDRETAYLFLLRDTLLPYAYFLNRGREKFFPGCSTANPSGSLRAGTMRTTRFGGRCIGRWKRAAMIFGNLPAGFCRRFGRPWANIPGRRLCCEKC